MLRIVTDAAELATAAADEFVRLTSRAVAAHGRCAVALAGGSTPLALYRLLATGCHDSVPWGGIHFFWGDERHVPPDHPDSNFRAAADVMLHHVPVPSDHIYRIHAELPDARAAAADYEQTLRDFFVIRQSQVPAFDLVLLGMGADGHIASLFPESEALGEQHRLVLAPWVEKFHAHRVTLSLPVLNNAAVVIVLVTGPDKAATLNAVLNGPHQPRILPAQAIGPTSGHVVWFVDRDAASRL